MTNTVQSIESEALALSQEERLDLIERLVATLAPPSPLHPAWDAELAQRVADLDAGRVNLLVGTDVFATLRARIGAHDREV